MQKSNYFPKLRSISWWLKQQFLEFLFLIKMIRFQYPFQLIKAQTRWILINSFVFPFLRILFGGEKAYKILDSLITNIHFHSLILSLAPLSKSKVMLRECVDLQVYREIWFFNGYFHEILKNGMNVIDVGAHIGTYTILAAEKVGKEGKVVAIEPEPENYKQLLENIKLNNFKNVIPIKIALTDHDGFEKLYLSPYSGGHSLLLKEDKISSIEVPVKTLDNLLQELNIKKVDVIKIDAEGAEIPILKGAEKTLKANPNVKILVASYHYPSEIKEASQFLNERGFKTKVSNGDVVITI